MVGPTVLLACLTKLWLRLSTTTPIRFVGLFCHAHFVTYMHFALIVPVKFPMWLFHSLFAHKFRRHLLFLMLPRSILFLFFLNYAYIQLIFIILFRPYLVFSPSITHFFVACVWFFFSFKCSLYLCIVCRRYLITCIDFIYWFLCRTRHFKEFAYHLKEWWLLL